MMLCFLNLFAQHTVQWTVIQKIESTVLVHS
jgi:hypothetical protein